MAWSAHHDCIFNAYKYSLGMGEIKGSNYNKMKVYITDSNFYATNSARIKGIYNPKAAAEELSLDYNKIRLGHLKGRYVWSAYNSNDEFITMKGISTKIIPTDLILENAYLDTFNKDTGFISQVSYEKVKGLAASSKIFSQDHDNSWVTNDLDWSIDANKNKHTEMYFVNEYDFKTDYEKTEYQSYGLKENRLEENVVRLSAESFLLNSAKASINTQAMDYGAAGALITYYDKKAGFVNENELPVAYFDFGKTLHSNYNYLKIDWHEDGVIKAE